MNVLDEIAAPSCSAFNPSSFAEDENGEVYVVTLNPAAGLGVSKLVP